MIRQFRTRQEGELDPLRTDETLLPIMLLPNTSEALTAYVWMQNRFKAQGDSCPTSREIHLEPIKKEEIYKDYVHEIKTDRLKLNIVTYDQFVRMWVHYFPHVKIREFKVVSGKCNTCSDLTDLRRKTRKNAVIVKITKYFALHRFTFMAERMKYYERIQLARSMPHRYYSIIIDGMAQNHSEMPYFANMKTFENKIKVHIIGIIEHGELFTILRCFGNIKSGADLTIYCILSQLEDRIRRYRCIPETVFIQVDGGSENANATVLMVLELLVARGFCKTIYLTRLPVGHTHEGRRVLECNVSFNAFVILNRY